MAKSITQKFGSPTIGKKKSKRNTATAKVSRILPKRGVELVFTGESATKPWLKRGTVLTVRGSLTCHGRRYLRVEGTRAGKSVVFCVNPAAAEAK